MSLPPVPPRPYQASTTNDGRPPPRPPVPPDLKAQTERYNTPSKYELESPPHFENPLIAPRPHRVDPSIPGNMARTLDDQLSAPQSGYQSPGVNYAPGFSLPTPAPVPGPPPASMNTWSPWAGANTGYQEPSAADVTQSLANLSMAPPVHISRPPPSSSSKPSSPAPAIPSLTAALPVLSQLQQAASVVQSQSHDPALKISWCRDVFLLIDKSQASGAPSTDPPVGPVNLVDPALKSLAQIAVPLALGIAGSYTPVQGQKMPPHIAEAISMRATLAATGAFPEFIPHNPRTAFRDFESAARGGFASAWFRLGRDYENFNDHAHAKECFERGAKMNVESCLYRMGMAHLLGQLSLPQNPVSALPLLQRAATLATIHCSQPAYVYALLLLNEFTQVTLPQTLFSPYIPSGSSPTLEARKHLERAAYLHFPAAQYKLGHAYEFAEPPFPFDPLLSVQYYSLASQQGEIEADMALSKWFLCGSGGAALPSTSNADTAAGGFEKDESLALTFASKAALRGLPSAEFAMGYYAEVGVGQPRDLALAREWYAKAHAHGNADAGARLAALSPSNSNSSSTNSNSTSDNQGGALTRQEHERITEQKLVRRRTMAAQRAEREPVSPPWEGTTFPTMGQAVELAEREGRGPMVGMGPHGMGASSSSGSGGGAAGGVGGQGQAQGRRREDGRMVVEVIRKNSMGYAYHPSNAQQPSSAPAPQTGFNGGRLHALREREHQHQQQQQPQSANPISGTGMATGMGTAAQRTQSPGRARRTESPSRLAYAPTPTPTRSESPSSYTATTVGGAGGGRRTPPAHAHPQTPVQTAGRVGRVGYPGGVPGGGAGGAGGGGSPTPPRGQSPGRLGRMRLNLDGADSTTAGSGLASASASSGWGSTTTPHTGIHTGISATQGGRITPRPGGGQGGQGAGGGARGQGAGGNATPNPSKHPQTFAEMGFHGAKADEKDCVVM